MRANANQTNTATIFVTLKPWAEREADSLQLPAVVARANRAIAGISEATGFAFNMPEIPGLGVTAGLEMYAQNRGVGDYQQFVATTREFLAEIKGAQFELDWASTLEAGLAEITRGRHHVYLIDYRLGKDSGLELLREAILHGCRHPIILLTGKGDHQVDAAAMAAGAADYLVKGEIDAAALERSIRHSILRKRTERDLHQQLTRISLLNQITHAISERQDLESVLNVVLAQLEALD